MFGVYAFCFQCPAWNVGVLEGKEAEWDPQGFSRFYDDDWISMLLFHDEMRYSKVVFGISL